MSTTNTQNEASSTIPEKSPDSDTRNFQNVETQNTGKTIPPSAAGAVTTDKDYNNQTNHPNNSHITLHDHHHNFHNHNDNDQAELAEADVIDEPINAVPKKPSCFDNPCHCCCSTKLSTGIKWVYWLGMFMSIAYGCISIAYIFRSNGNHPDNFDVSNRHGGSTLDCLFYSYIFSVFMVLACIASCTTDVMMFCTLIDKNTDTPDNDNNKDNPVAGRHHHYFNYGLILHTTSFTSSMFCTSIYIVICALQLSSITYVLSDFSELRNSKLNERILRDMRDQPRETKLSEEELERLFNKAVDNLYIISIVTISVGYAFLLLRIWFIFIVNAFLKHVLATKQNMASRNYQKYTTQPQTAVTLPYGGQNNGTTVVQVPIYAPAAPFYGGYYNPYGYGYGYGYGHHFGYYDPYCDWW